MSATGQCLCGAVRITATLVDGTVGACHCVQCQRWTGGGPLYTVRVTDLSVEGEEALARYRASAWGERVFCRHCGAKLWWKMQGKPTGSIAAGLLDDQSALRVAEEIFVDHRPGWMPAFAGAGQSTEAEEMAKLEDYLSEERP